MMLKVVKLLKLYVENFRGIKNFVLTPDGRSATVQGGNGTGKSTLMAAFLWLLTGKDAQGRENYNVFPLGTDGNRLSGCSPTVTATLSMPDGHTLVLQRSICERWTKRRGSAETEYNKQLDEEQMKSLQLEQQRVTNHNKLSEMEMNLKVSRMELDRKAVELRNERYLDSLGAGTTDKVRQVELDYNVSILKLKEDEQKYKNEQALAEADLKVKKLELNIFRKSLAETRRTLEDAQIRSPRRAILTYVNNEIGSQIGQGAKVAIVSDLSHFKIEGEIADTYGDRIAAGSKAVIKIGSEKLDGTVSDVTPLSKNGVISFTVQLEEDNHKRLRSGLKTDIYVMNAVKDDVLRIANSSYYVGKGEYELFVVNGDQLLKRKVQLGDSNFEYVEVVSGLQEGDQVIVSDMNAYKDKNKLKIED